MEKFDSKDYNWGQLHQIRLGIEEGLDIRWYLNPKFLDFEMEFIRETLKFEITDKVDTGSYVKFIAKPELGRPQMEAIWNHALLFERAKGLPIGCVASQVNINANLKKMIKQIKELQDMHYYINERPEFNSEVKDYVRSLEVKSVSSEEQES